MSIAPSAIDYLPVIGVDTDAAGGVGVLRTLRSLRLIKLIRLAKSPSEKTREACTLGLCSLLSLKDSVVYIMQQGAVGALGVGLPYYVPAGMFAR